MIRAALPVVFVSLVLASADRPVVAQSSVINPVGSYAVTSTDETGAPVTGTLTVRAAEGGYVGEFVSEDGTVPFLQVTTNGQHFMGILDLTDYLAVTWLQRQEDGTFKGTWHQLSPGIPVTATKK